MSTETPDTADPLASGPQQELVLVPTSPRSRLFHNPRPDHKPRPVCHGFHYDGQLVPRWYAEDDGRRACPGCFSTQENDT